jgi:hypothetical protein
MLTTIRLSAFYGRRLLLSVCFVKEQSATADTVPAGRRATIERTNRAIVKHWPPLLAEKLLPVV